MGLVLPGATGAAPSGRHPVLHVSDVEVFNCKKNAALCREIQEQSLSSHESAVLFSDQTGRNHLSLHCRVTIPGICPARATAKVSERFRWFAAPAACDENGCHPVTGPCTPQPFQTCTPVIWRAKPDTWTLIGCKELSSRFALGCAQRGSPSVSVVNPIELFGGTYPDDTFWPAVSGHYTFGSPELFGTEVCDFLGLERCPPPGINVQIQVSRLGPRAK